MRQPVDSERIRRLMKALGAVAQQTGRVYFTGGATAVLSGWRSSTIDVDLVFVRPPRIPLPYLPKLINTSSAQGCQLRLRALEGSRRQHGGN